MGNEGLTVEVKLEDWCSLLIQELGSTASSREAWLWGEFLLIMRVIYKVDLP